MSRLCFGPTVFTTTCSLSGGHRRGQRELQPHGGVRPAVLQRQGHEQVRAAELRTAGREGGVRCGSKG